MSADVGARELPGFQPLAAAEVELSTGIEPPPAVDGTGRPYGGARILVRLHGEPLGTAAVTATADGFSARQCADAIWTQLGERINAHLRADGLAPVSALTTGALPAVSDPQCQARRRAVLANPPFASVIVCTKDRPDVLARALSAIAALEYPNYETLVIDGSAGSATEDLVTARFPAVHYHRLPGGRLIVGRNRGLAEAGGELLAYTDDDAVVDRHWLTEHVAGFDDAGTVACTTGLAVPLELDAPAQVWFEELGAFVEGFEPRTIAIATRDRRSLLPYATGRIGSGVSMAWRASVLRELGGFDLALDALGGEDIAAFFDALCAGYAVRYCPRALVRHEHRRTYEELRSQVRSYARGLGAYLTRCVLTQPGRLGDFLLRVPLGLVYAFHPSSIRHNKKSAGFPEELNRQQLPGLLSGPWAYLKARRSVPRLRELAKPHPEAGAEPA